MAILSKTDERYIINIFGIKLSILNSKYKKILKENNVNYYIKNNIDITALPPAEGKTRKLQLANFELLKELDYVCKVNNISYWLDFGTLIGAVRHKGFIPWDDDIDVGMMGKDYSNIIEIFNKTTRNPDIYAEKTYGLGKKSILIKILHKKCEHLFLDIFPYEYYGEKLSESERLKKTKEIKKYRKKYIASISSGNTIAFERKLKIARNDLLKHEVSEDSDLVWGIEFGHQWQNWLHDVNTIFPLRTLEFEGMEFPVVNNPELHLKRIYGDFMTYPHKISLGHNRYKEFSEEELRAIDELIIPKKS